VAPGNTSSLAVSPDGNWLFALDAGGLTVQEYQINPSTGVLTFFTANPVVGTTGSVVTPSQVTVAPSGQYVIVALGTAGTMIMPFNTSTGVAGPGYTSIPTGSASAGDYSAVMDGGNNLYIARTTGLAVYTVNSAGTATSIAGSPFATGAGPHSVLLSKSFNYVYVGNQTDSTISEFRLASGPTLTALVGSPVTGPTLVASMGTDTTGAYVIGAGFNSTSGTQLYSIGLLGGLSVTTSGTAPTGTTNAIPTVLALTH
jgi:6-phosphogluconolactonase